MIDMTKKQAKTLASGLRRSLKELDSTQISHSAACELLAKSFGFRNWSAFNASLREDTSETPPLPIPSKYPLSNTGQFDFTDSGVFVSGCTFVAMKGTLEVIPECTSNVSTVSRGAKGKVTLEFEGGTDINWDAQKPMLDEEGVLLWVSEDYKIFSQSHCVLAPEVAQFDIDDPDTALPIRPPLVKALLDYLVDAKQVELAREELAANKTLSSSSVENAESVIWFCATYPERAELLKALTNLK